jgi:hypothetical protein
MSSTESFCPERRKKPPSTTKPTSGRIRAVHMIILRFRSFIADRVYHNRPGKARQRGKDLDKKRKTRYKINL